MKQDAQDTIGKFLTGTHERDAIHIAMAQVKAEVGMLPGAHIGFTGNNLVSNRAEKLIGIVDPFLTRSVQAGEEFWMLLYPNTITNLRHAWEHPDFTTITNSEDSEQYVRNFCKEEGVPYESLIDAFQDDNWDEYVTVRDYDMHGIIPDTLLFHIRRLIGDIGNPTYFSCSC